MLHSIRDPHASFDAPAVVQPLLTLLLAAGLLIAAQPQALAATKTWTNTNAGTATWNRPNNWSTTTTPASGDTALINNGGTALLPIPVTGTYTTLDIGTVSGTSGNVTISGGTLSAAGTSPSSNLGVAAGGTGQVTMSAGTWNAGLLAAGLSGTGTINLSGGALNSDGSSAIGTNPGGVGTVTVSGGTWINAGALYVGKAGTGILNLTNTGAVTLSSGNLVIANDTGSAGTLNLGTGTTAGTANTTTIQGGSGNATVNFNQSGNYTFAPALTGNLSVNVIGSGITTLTGTNDYTGDTIVTNGALIVQGDESAVTGTTTVQTGTKLGGTGIIGGDVTIQSGGTLSPGLSPGLLTFMDSVTMEASSTLEMQITGTNTGLYDQLFVGGIFTGGGTLDLNVSYAATAGDTFLLFTSGGFDSGSFTIATNLTGGLTWDDSQLASTGMVSIVPEPSTLVLSGLALIALAAFVQRYRRAEMLNVMPSVEKD